MKYCFPEVNNVFDTEDDKVNTMVIENASLFLKVLTDIQVQVEGGEGVGVLSDKDCILRMDKRAEVIDRYVPFYLNQKSLLTKVGSTIEKRIVEEDCYLRTMELLANIEAFLLDVTNDMAGGLEFDQLSPGALVKASGFHFDEDYTSLGEKILDYMELVYEYLGEKLFFTINLRSYLTDEEADMFMEGLLQHGFHCIMLESYGKKHLSREKRYLVDADLCEIC